MNSIVINFKKITNLKIVWNIMGDIEKIEFTKEPEELATYPEKVKKILLIFDNYYSKPTYEIKDILPMERFSEFYKKVYTTLSRVPMGDILSYRELSKISGYPEAARAVGSALRKNRYPLIIPCHRVVGSNKIGGFTPDIQLKIELLKKEGFL
ncbi:MAG: MGMT family protein [Calditerrivibrio sp.]|nr:MGMT family protein [Calditerrivibrio sp.]MCA1932960.1 MGMT family protein [Calditerrivibrio sp.]